MIVWCAYCQQFNGEKAPLDDFSMSHGVCKACIAAKATRPSAEALAKLRSIAAFYDEIRAQAEAGQAIEVAQVVDRGHSQLGLRSLDLCMGILQPILYQMGKLWENGQLTVTAEHAFSTFADQLALEMARDAKSRAEVGGLAEASDACQIILCCGEGGGHGFELRGHAFVLREAGMKVRLFYPGLPTSEILGIVDTYHPQILGIFLASSEQIPGVKNLIQRLQAVPSGHTPTLLLLRSRQLAEDKRDLGYPPGAVVAPNDASELVELTQKLLSDISRV